jgi:head-tail adaptor
VSARNHKAIFERLVQPADLFTGEAGQWEEVCREWVSLAPVQIFAQRFEFTDAAQITSQRKSIAKTIYSASTARITTDCRMTVGERVFEIVQLINTDEQNREFELLVVEKT